MPRRPPSRFERRKDSKRRSTRCCAKSRKRQSSMTPASRTRRSSGCVSAEQGAARSSLRTERRQECRRHMGMRFTRSLAKAPLPTRSAAQFRRPTSSAICSRRSTARKCGRTRPLSRSMATSSAAPFSSEEKRKGRRPASSRSSVSSPISNPSSAPKKRARPASPRNCKASKRSCTPPRTPASLPKTARGPRKWRCAIIAAVAITRWSSSIDTNASWPSLRKNRRCTPKRKSNSFLGAMRRSPISITSRRLNVRFTMQFVFTRSSSELRARSSRK